MNNKKAIGIIGGLGPQASLYMCKLLIEMSVKYFGAKNNDEFPEIILHSIPVPGFIADDSEKKIAFEMLKNRVIKLNKLSIAYLAIACNTAHVLLRELQAISQIPFLSIIDEVVKAVKKDKIKKVGLLATPSTIRYSIYQDALQKNGIEVVLPSRLQQKSFENIINNVLAEKITARDKKKLLSVADNLKKIGAQGIILGCTELPLIFPEKYSLPVYNSVKILALALLRKYYGKP